MTNSKLDCLYRDGQIVKNFHVKSGELPSASISVNEFESSGPPVASLFTI